MKNLNNRFVVNVTLVDSMILTKVICDAICECPYLSELPYLARTFWIKLIKQNILYILSVHICSLYLFHHSLIWSVSFFCTGRARVRSDLLSDGQRRTFKMVWFYVLRPDVLQVTIGNTVLRRHRRGCRRRSTQTPSLVVTLGVTC